MLVRGKALRLLTVLLMIMFGSGAIGCGGRDVRVTYDRHVDFGRLQTYQLVQGRQFGVAHQEIDGRSIAEVAIDSADRQLSRKGYRRVDVGDVDFFIRNDLNLDYKKTQEIRDRPEPRTRPPTRVPEVDAEGTVILEVLSPTDSRSWWRAETHATLPQDVPSDQQIRQLDQIMDRLLRRFPPK